ncbi:MAG: deaminase [Actinobacteria bacterium]|nr:deaminase [Actinomycetota bacterium]
MSKPLGPYTPVVRAGDFLITSGQIGQLEGKLVDGGIVAETRQAMENLKTVLESEGASLSDVVKTTVFLADIDEWPAMNDPYIEALGDHRPARSAFGVGALPMGARVEIEAWAYRPAS